MQVIWELQDFGPSMEELLLAEDEKGHIRLCESM